MSISPTSLSNIDALHQSLQLIDHSAQRISRLPEDESIDLISELVTQKSATLSARAQLNVIRAQDETLESIIDELA